MIIDKNELTKEFLRLFYSTEGNTIPDDAALDGCEGLVMFEEPIFGISDAKDSIYMEFKRSDVIGDPFLMPEEWLKGARSVIAFFLPFTERVKVSNRCDLRSTSPEWLHARIEGQTFINRYLEAIRRFFQEMGAEACVPCLDKRFSIRKTPIITDSHESLHFASGWSERHAAYASGLGTFSLSRSLITEKGTAGRFGSIIVSLGIKPDKREYTGITDYCIMCGQCIGRCPFGAIDIRTGKDQKICSSWVDETKERYAPRYGCGKCQICVPCENGIPVKV